MYSEFAKAAWQQGATSACAHLASLRQLLLGIQASGDSWQTGATCACAGRLAAPRSCLVMRSPP